MERVLAWWRGVERERKVMLGALTLLTFSQFLQTTVDSGRAMLHVDAEFNTGMTMWFDSYAAIGWRVHPLAWLIIPFLALVYLTSLHRRKFWQSFGYWITVVLFMAAMAPKSMQTWGGTLGMISIGLALVAAVMHWRWPAVAARAEA